MLLALMPIASKHLLALMCSHLLALSFFTTRHYGHSLIKIYSGYLEKNGSFSSFPFNYHQNKAFSQGFGIDGNYFCSIFLY